MLLYNIELKRIEDKDIIVLDNGDQMYPTTFTDEELVKLGYKKVNKVEADRTPKDMEHIVVKHKEELYHYDLISTVETKPLDLIVEDFKKFVQEILDTKARLKGYDNIVSVCSYAGYENEYQVEGVKFGKWRAKVWQWGYKMLADIQSGVKELPKSFIEAVQDMPQLEE